MFKLERFSRENFKRGLNYLWKPIADIPYIVLNRARTRSSRALEQNVSRVESCQPDAGNVDLASTGSRAADVVDSFAEFFVDHAAFDLEGWGHFAFVDREFAGQQIDAFDAFVVAHLAR